MSNQFLLYDRSKALGVQAASLRVQGELPDYQAGLPFVGSLDVINGVGRCKVEVLASTLPPGHTVRIDNIQKKVFVRWPGYRTEAETAKAVPNGDFADGDDGSWFFSTPWSIKPTVGEGRGPGAEFGKGFKGTSSIEGMRVSYNGERITASARFQQGGSSKGNLGGRILLIWCDELGNMLPGGEGTGFAGGNLISSGSNGEWKTSTVTAASQKAKMVAVGFSCKRSSQNEIAAVDNFTWDHEYIVGYPYDNKDFFLRIKVTDGLNRVAYWEGRIWAESVWFTSKLYPLWSVESPIGVDFSLSGLEVIRTVREEAVSDDVMGMGMTVFGFEMVSSEPPKPVEQVSMNMSVSSISLRDIDVYKFLERGSFDMQASSMIMVMEPHSAHGDNLSMDMAISEVSLK